MVSLLLHSHRQTDRQTYRQWAKGRPGGLTVARTYNCRAAWFPCFYIRLIGMGGRLWQSNFRVSAVPQKSFRRARIGPLLTWRARRRRERGRRRGRGGGWRGRSSCCWVQRPCRTWGGGDGGHLPRGQLLEQLLAEQLQVSGAGGRAHGGCLGHLGRDAGVGGEMGGKTNGRTGGGMDKRADDGTHGGRSRMVGLARRQLVG